MRVQYSLAWLNSVIKTRGNPSAMKTPLHRCDLVLRDLFNMYVTVRSGVLQASQGGMFARAIWFDLFFHQVRNWTAISWRPLLRGRDRTTSQAWVLLWLPGPKIWILQVCPTARDSFNRNETPLMDESRVVTSWVVLANTPSSTVRRAEDWTGRRLSRRRSTVVAPTGNVAGGRISRLRMVGEELLSALKGSKTGEQ